MPQNVEQDFSGGITDYYLDPLQNKHAWLDNFLLTKDRTATVRPGSLLYLNTDRAVGGRVNKLFYFKNVLFKIIGEELYYHDVSWQLLSGPELQPALFGATEDTRFSVVEQNSHVMISSDDGSFISRKIYQDSLGNWRIFTAGYAAPIFNTSYPTFAGTNAGKSYIYYFVRSSKYMVDGGVSFEDIGAVSLFQVANMPDKSIGSDTITITPAVGNVWPFIANTNFEYADTANETIDVYRTKTDATVGYYVGSIPYGSTVAFVDSVSDTLLGHELYLNGDVLDWDQPPRAKYLVQCQDTVWYLNCSEYEAGVWVKRPNRIRQDIAFGLGKAPSSFYTDVDGDITGGGSVGDFPIIFSRSKMWRLEGSVDTQGNGFTRKVLISDTVGCISNDSIIQSQRGIAFAGNDGFYFTDGYNVIRISDDLALTYPKLISNVINSVNVLTVAKDLRISRINGCYDRFTDRYWWSLQTDKDNLDNDTYYVWDANFGTTANASFTTVSSGADMYPSASIFVDGDLIRGDIRGYVFKHEDKLRGDLVVDETLAVSSWVEKAIPYDYISSARSMGDSTITKWAGVIQLVFINAGDLTVEAQTSDDDQDDWASLKEMRFRGSYVWGQLSLVWGDRSAIWNYRSFIFFERRFPRGSLRFTYKQIRLLPSYTVIAASGDLNLGIFDPGTETVLLDGSSTIFEQKFVGYFVHYEQDNYSTAFEILAVSLDGLTATLSEDNGLLTVGSYRWEVRGYSKGERLILKNHIISYEPFGDSQRGFRTSDGIGNG